jgi:hypothetical protein
MDNDLIDNVVADELEKLRRRQKMLVVAELAKRARQVGECPKTTPEVGAAIAQMRREAGLSVAEIARITQLSRRTVYSVLYP